MVTKQSSPESESDTDTGLPKGRLDGRYSHKGRSPNVEQ
jgi:hypothetical protein